MQKKTRRILVDKILELQYNPYPGGNKERLDYPHPPVVYRLHVSRSFTIFYIIKEGERTIRVEKIMTSQLPTTKVAGLRLCINSGHSSGWLTSHPCGSKIYLKPRIVCNKSFNCFIPDPGCPKLQTQQLVLKQNNTYIRHTSIYKYAIPPLPEGRGILAMDLEAGHRSSIYRQY